MTYGQLYTALLCIRHHSHAKIWLHPQETTTTNVTYEEILIWCNWYCLYLSCINIFVFVTSYFTNPIFKSLTAKAKQGIPCLYHLYYILQVSVILWVLWDPAQITEWYVPVTIAGMVWEIPTHSIPVKNATPALLFELDILAILLGWRWALVF